MMPFSFHTVPEIIVGADSALTLGSLCERLGVRKPLLVTDAGLVDIGLIGPVVSAMIPQCPDVSVFSGVTADPAEAVVEAALSDLREQHCDGVIAVGGGSSMDVAKVIAVLAAGDQRFGGDHYYG